ncbi:MAG TPA: hypothetical protein VLI40_13370, partial [Gemmatimonadaceae bacterium]|nr:hypothetical protein [Gemmatimonadaceae bacterium]
DANILVDFRGGEARTRSRRGRIGALRRLLRGLTGRFGLVATLASTLEPKAPQQVVRGIPLWHARSTD